MKKKENLRLVVKSCLGTWRVEEGLLQTDRKGYVLPETTTMDSLPYTTPAQRKRKAVCTRRRRKHKEKNQTNRQSVQEPVSRKTRSSPTTTVRPDTHDHHVNSWRFTGKA